jgi:Zn-dependent protease
VRSLDLYRLQLLALGASNHYTRVRMTDPALIVISLFVLAYSCILHECAHVWVALKLGDATGRDEGRLTLNPVPHIDPFWTILLPLFMLFTTGLMIGGPKPAPVNPLNFRSPRLGAMWTAVAGPATNLLLAALAFGLLWLLRSLAADWVPAETLRDSAGRVIGHEASWNAVFFFTVMQVNVVLAALNLIPIPPLDGSRFLQYLLGPRSDAVMTWVSRLGVLPVAVAAFVILPRVLPDAVRGLRELLGAAFGEEYAGALVMGYFKLIAPR